MLIEGRLRRQINQCHRWTKPRTPTMNDEATDNPSAEPKSSTAREAKKKSPNLVTIQYMHSFWPRLSQCPLENKRSTFLRLDTPSKRKISAKESTQYS